MTKCIEILNMTRLTWIFFTTNFSHVSAQQLIPDKEELLAGLLGFFKKNSDQCSKISSSNTTIYGTARIPL